MIHGGLNNGWRYDIPIGCPEAEAEAALEAPVESASFMSHSQALQSRICRDLVSWVSLKRHKSATWC